MLAIVRRQIIRGDRQPGERINEAAVAAELGVSRTPARTALTALAAEGLIEKRDGRGFTVGRVSATDVAKAIEVRASLESLAAGLMAWRSAGLYKGIAEERRAAADEPGAAHALL